MLIFVLGLLIAVATVFTGLTYLFFIYETVNDPTGMARSSGGRDLLTPANLGRGFFSSMASAVLVTLTFPLGLARGLSKPAQGSGRDREPVLLVHGLYHNSAAWILFSRHLRRAGYERIYRWSYSSFNGDFERIAAGLCGAVEEIHRETGEPVVLIGHSLGGVLIRRVLSVPECAGMVRAGVTLGSPHRGSKLAALALGGLGRELLPPGPLAQDRPIPESPPKLNLHSPLDNLVLPASSLNTPEPGWTEEHTPPMSHVSMLYHPWVARRVVDFLEGRKPAGSPDTP
jgi:triacylglycerol lipase